MFLAVEIIQKKKSGIELSNAEISFMVQSFTKGDLPEYQMSAWLMAIYFKGLTAPELSALTDVMMNSGRILDFSHLKNLAVDKHSTGGVGDKTTLIICALVAAAGVLISLGRWVVSYP